MSNFILNIILPLLQLSKKINNNVIVQPARLCTGSVSNLTQRQSVFRGIQ